MAENSIVASPQCPLPWTDANARHCSLTVFFRIVPVGATTGPQVKCWDVWRERWVRISGIVSFSSPAFADWGLWCRSGEFVGEMLSHCTDEGGRRRRRRRSHGPFTQSDVGRGSKTWSLATPTVSPSQRVCPGSGYTRRCHQILHFRSQRAVAAFWDGRPMHYPRPQRCAIPDHSTARAVTALVPVVMGKSSECSWV